MFRSWSDRLGLHYSANLSKVHFQSSSWGLEFRDQNFTWLKKKKKSPGAATDALTCISAFKISWHLPWRHCQDVLNEARMFTTPQVVEAMSVKEARRWSDECGNFSGLNVQLVWRNRSFSSVSFLLKLVLNLSFCCDRFCVCVLCCSLVFEHSGHEFGLWVVYLFSQCVRINWLY